MAARTFDVHAGDVIGQQHDFVGVQFVLVFAQEVGDAHRSGPLGDEAFHREVVSLNLDFRAAFVAKVEGGEPAPDSGEARSWAGSLRR